MLEAIKVCKAFDGKAVLRDFSLSIGQNQRYCLMGPSGCGKTTAIRLLMGLCEPDSGEVRGLSRLRFSAVFQENRLLEQMTALGNVRFASPAPDDAIKARLNELGLERECLLQPVNTFSGGMKRRVALCRALMADYDVLFLDEPYKGLDEATKANVMAVVQASAQRKTVVLVTHDLQEAAGYDIVTMKPL